MTQKEKAMAYDNAIEKAKKINRERYKKGFKPSDDVLYIFPELKESEDEQIRKALIEGFKVMKDNSYGECTFSNYNIPVTNIIDWLEKQNSNVDNANKEYWRGYREGKQEILDKYAELEKKGEQKHIEPKFKVGDKIVENNEFGMIGGEITDIDTTHYELDGGGTYIPISHQDNYRLVREQKSVDKIEHTRIDAFIENTCEWIMNHFSSEGFGSPLYYKGLLYRPEDIVEDYKKDMKLKYAKN